MISNTINKYKWFLLVAATIIVTRSTTFFTSYIDDEEAFTAIARVMLHGGTPYLSFVDNKPPLLYYWYAFWLWLFGDSNILAIHIVGMFWVGLTSFVLYRIGKLVYDEKAGLFAALCYVIYTTSYIPPYIAVHASLIESLPLALSVWFFTKWYRYNNGRWLFLSGIFCGIAVFIRYQALVQVGFTFLAFGYLYFYKFKSGLRSLLSAIVNFTLGVLVVAILVMLFLHSKDAIIPFYENTWKASFSYMKVGESAAHFWKRLFLHVGTYIPSTMLLWIALVNQMRHRAVKIITGEPVDKPYSMLIFIWFVVTIPAVLAGGRFYGHYFIQILLPLCIIGGVQISEWWYRDPRRWVRHAIVISFVICSVGWMCPRIWYQYFADRQGYHNLRTEQKIGAYLNEHMPKGSKLYVWGLEPTLYIFADRDPATRYLWSDWQTGRSSGVEETQKGNLDTSSLVDKKHWAYLMEDLGKNAPLYIVDCSSGDLRDYSKFPIQKYPLIFSYLTANYGKETVIDGVDIYRRR